MHSSTHNLVNNLCNADFVASKIADSLLQHVSYSSFGTKHVWVDLQQCKFS